MSKVRKTFNSNPLPKCVVDALVECGVMEEYHLYEKELICELEDNYHEMSKKLWYLERNMEAMDPECRNRRRITSKILANDSDEDEEDAIKKPKQKKGPIIEIEEELHSTPSDVIDISSESEEEEIVISRKKPKYEK